MAWFALPLFILLSLGGGGLVGLAVETGGWYAALEKPGFNPPNWVFGPVWTTLYILIGIAGWRVWRIGDQPLQGLWWTQLILNFAWTPIFFAAQQLLVAFGVILALDAMIVVFVVNAWRNERIAALLFLPYALWTSYATILNVSLWWMNA
ncbi:tryptophan-rich sensory protein [Fulvimarina pelagi HTCC2506]|uniref:Tryptophan-rich sensory protein n=2 Tax=Fulvimarina pelagi TaxID=217511 RepID=Q0G1J8_9HYPH|nr:TspO/MBR family protein [Fulvimarina pelagi]EAU41083.1 tryptophan-rich sensory protein [Fulvimarina pelagi HTCC2506]BAT30903.1 tryptophan-rich sensory protein [Fulvimarina pelagi]